MKDFFQLISPNEFLSLCTLFSPLTEERLPLAECLGRVARPGLTAPENLPPFSRSTMDGFAVRARDTFGCSESEPALLRIVGEVAMGKTGDDLNLRPGCCAHIWTGGELPAKADGVVMVEYTHQLDEQTVEVFRPVAPGENVIRAGEDCRAGDPILPKGRLLRPQDLGLLAGLGLTELSVYKRPRVGIISTGDELLPPEAPLVPGKIRDINSTTLAALVTESGGTPTCYGIIDDDPDHMLAACETALQTNDILLLSGGSSVGRRDFTLQVLERIRGSELLAHGVAVRPGKPTLLARRGNQAIFGLPGHVASAMVVFFLFVRPLLRLFMGLEAHHGLRQITARLSEQVPSAIGREEYVRVRLKEEAGRSLPLATPIHGKSGLLRPLVKADGLLVIGRDTEGLDKDSRARVLCFP